MDKISYSFVTFPFVHLDALYLMVNSKIIIMQCHPPKKSFYVTLTKLCPQMV